MALVVMSWSGHAQSQTPDAMNLMNWMRHPVIEEVRELYQKINVGVTTGHGNLTDRMFDSVSPLCASYPIHAEALHYDEAGVVQRFDVTRRESRSELLKIFRYYDDRRIILFVKFRGQYTSFSMASPGCRAEMNEVNCPQSCSINHR